MNFNRLFLLTLLCVSLLFTAKACKKATKGFSISLISSNRSMEIQREQKEIDPALCQRYTYFNRGSQVFAFVSEDGNYILKFFNQHLYRPVKWLEKLPIPILQRYFKRHNLHRIDKQERDFLSYQLAYEKLQDLTGILFVHLNRTDHLQKKLTLIDPIGISHQINLDDFDFVIQKRAVLVYDRINALMSLGQEKEAKEAIQEVFNLIRTRAGRGFDDRDPDIGSNCGFIQGKAVKIDVGRLVPMPSMQERENQEKEVETIALPFKEWIAIHHPSLLDQFEEKNGQTL